jgi:lipopolysaccharide/colanic/teichoic acid biosynthesis glycosyltransferase
MFEVGNLHEAAGTALPAVGSWCSVEASKTTAYQRFCKRGVDVIFSAIALIVLLPLLFVIAGFVRVKLGPGVLYCQSRFGRHGRNFVMLRFRTMHGSHSFGVGHGAVVAGAVDAGTVDAGTVDSGTASATVGSSALPDDSLP